MHLLKIDKDSRLTKIMVSFRNSWK